MLIKLIATCLSTGVYFFWSFCIFWLIAIGDEPGQFLLAVYADLFGLIILFVSMRLAKLTNRKKFRVVNSWTLFTITTLSIAFVVQILFDSSNLAMEFHTPEYIAEVHSYLIYLICTHIFKLSFSAWDLYGCKTVPAR